MLLFTLIYVDVIATVTDVIVYAYLIVTVTNVIVYAYLCRCNSDCH